VPEEKERVDVPQVQGTGTLTMFCALNGQHYALTCFHVGCGTDENRLNAAFNKVEDVQKMRNSLSAYESYAKKQQYYFTQGNTKNDNEPILFGDDGTDCTRLGGFDNYNFDNECDILSLKVLDGVKTDCKIADATSPDWDSIWDELYESDSNPVEVEKTGFSSALTCGYIVPCDFSYSQEQEPLFQDAFAVKGCSGPFLEGGDWCLVLSFSFMTRITRNRCLPMGFAKWMSFSYQNSTSQRVLAVLMKTNLSLNRKSRMRMKLYLRVLRLNVRMKKVNVKMDGKIKINRNVKKNGLFFRKKVRATFRSRKWREKKKKKVRATFR
jgi:hypothetical protein